ncbi:hypothetical protein BOTBODRAFT_179918 [Botryobasidium botryosum FD-172 SS1]|uniref:Ubiquitin-like protease family profile domain-containing protein n=1 Tax=Botryobasidium botryosum (strain FD-172 SS1) TaxID=930990 RepID=A0A067LYV6_BOTB1|nr:hypothetical protein BOTBODRAFT_179918 [Botryobasidium botryosum FD-172 SS1]
MADMGDLIIAQKAGDQEKVSTLLETMCKSMRKIFLLMLEVRWDRQELRYYDSLPERPAAIEDAIGVAEKARFLLHIVRDCLDQDLKIEKWTWVDEKRPTRQTNTYDCGPFACADMVSLAATGLPSTMTQGDMADWRTSMLQSLRALEPRATGKRRRSLELGPVIDLELSLDIS